MLHNIVKIIVCGVVMFRRQGRRGEEDAKKLRKGVLPKNGTLLVV